MTRVFVTGGSGFVGRRLIGRLVGEGHEVTALSRSPDSDQVLRGLGAEPVRGDLDSVEAWQESVAGHEVVVHSAAPVTVWGDKAVLQRQIVDATLALRDACERHRVRRMIHLSSESVLQGGAPLVGIDETHPWPARPNSRYGTCKKAAEQGLLAKRGNTEIIVLRPSFIWGPGGQITQVLDKVKNGGFVWVDQGRAAMELSHVANVVEAIILGFTQGRPGQVYFITDGEDLDVRAVLGGIIEAMGLTAPQKSLPLWLARPAAGMIERIWALSGMSSPPPLSRFQLDFVALPRRYSIARARAELGYEPVMSFRAGLAEIRQDQTLRAS